MRSLILILLLPLSLSAQYKYWISFSDKGKQAINITEVSLSERAIERRNRQNIAISVSDLPVYTDYIQAVRNLGFKVLNRSRWFNGIMVSTNDSLLVNSLASLPFVTDVYNFQTHNTSNARLSNKLEVIDSSFYGDAFRQLDMLNGHDIHQLGYQGEGMHIAVLDAGFRKVDELAAFESLFENNQILGSWDFVSQESSVYEDHSHGMAVLSTIGARLEGEFVGTAPQAKFWLLRTEDAASENLIEEYNWLCAAEFADSVGADIINSSLGYTTFDIAEQDHTYADLDGRTTPISKAAVMASRKGMIVCSSAGNYGNNSWHYLGAPADADSILSVGAVYADETPTSFSSFGPSADNRVKPSISAQGGNTTVYSTEDYVATSNGTSFSSPIIAGMTACLWQANPDKTNTEVMNAIMQSANLYNTPDDQLGYGIPNYTLANALLSIEDETNSFLSVYPNPLKNYSQLYAFVVNAENITYSLYNIKGKLLAFQEVSSSCRIIQIDIPQLSVGIYILEVLVGEERLQERIVVTQ